MNLVVLKAEIARLKKLKQLSEQMFVMKEDKEYIKVNSENHALLIPVYK